MTVTEFLAALRHVARVQADAWYVGSLLCPTSGRPPVLRHLHTGVCFASPPARREDVPAHCREVCPVEAVALAVGFAPDRRPARLCRTPTYFDLARAVGLDEPDLHRLFHAIDTDCRHSADAAPLRAELFAILRPRRSFR